MSHPIRLSVYQRRKVTMKKDSIWTGLTMLFLTPANEVWGKVMFPHLCVILFTEGRGVCPTPPHADPKGLSRPPGCRTSKMQTPWVGQTPCGLGRPPTGWANPPPPSDTVNKRPVRILLECILVQSWSQSADVTLRFRNQSRLLLNLILGIIAFKISEEKLFQVIALARIHYITYVSLQLLVKNVVSTEPCVGKMGISLVLLNFLDCKFRLWFETP